MCTLFFQGANVARKGSIQSSSHSYHFNINYTSTDIAVDAGAAEGIWSLDIIDKIKELYLFECDDDCIEPLRATFAPWKNN